MEASFEFVNFLSWLRTIDERLDRSWRQRSSKRVGLVPSLADGPLRERVKELVGAFRSKALERQLANFVLHTGAVPEPWGGASLDPDHRISLRIPDRPEDRVDTRWHLSYEEERDALNVAREAALAVELLVDELLDALERASHAAEEERNRKQSSRPPAE